MKHIVILLTLVALLGKDLLRVLSLFTVRSQEAEGKYLGMLSFLSFCFLPLTLKKKVQIIQTIVCISFLNLYIFNSFSNTFKFFICC